MLDMVPNGYYNGSVRGCAVKVVEKTLTTMIKEERKKAGLTQPQMSDLFEIPLPTIKKWDSGVRDPAPWAGKLVVEKLRQYRMREGIKLDLMDFKETQDFQKEVAALEERLERERRTREKLPPEERKRIDENLKILAAFHSNAIEGNPMSLNEVKELLGWKEKE